MNTSRKDVYKSLNAKTCCPRRKHDEIEPKKGLSYSPSDMAKLHAKGMPINSANIVESFYDGDLNPSFDIPLERQRGLDPAEIWEASQNSAKKVNKLSKAANSKKK